MVFIQNLSKKYARLDTIIEKAVKKYTKDVKSKNFQQKKIFYMDQNLDKKIEFKEKLTNFYSNNRFKIYLLLFSLFIGIIVSLSLKYYYEKNNLISNKYTQAVLYLSNKDYEDANQIFDEIILSKNKFYSILSN